MFGSMGEEGFAERARRELVATGEKVRKRQDDTRDALKLRRADREGLHGAEKTNT